MHKIFGKVVCEYGQNNPGLMKCSHYGMRSRCQSRVFQTLSRKACIAEPVQQRMHNRVYNGARARCNSVCTKVYAPQSMHNRVYHGAHARCNSVCIMTTSAIWFTLSVIGCKRCHAKTFRMLNILIMFAQVVLIILQFLTVYIFKLTYITAIISKV